MKEFRERVLIPLLIPLGALAIIAVVVLNISRVLLALEEGSGPHTVATRRLGNGSAARPPRGSGERLATGCPHVALFAQQAVCPKPHGLDQPMRGAGRGRIVETRGKPRFDESCRPH